ncbi:YitT family protein [Heliorestis acidaminivorans]|uniref:YitT family protein n=1 Tax=Heliorestis acidaminivorans TaxID=553427 RepID=A0A6I0EZJ8_9FIRM|nr:YitT family protein [Heliorestis acidaminivorans]KAB2952379.1 YitT family protein [Heliorestis acidaminivorans]
MKIKKIPSQSFLIGERIFLLIGSFFVALALETFLAPNKIMDGGTTGLAIILSHLTPLYLGFWIVLLNIPFLFIGHYYFGAPFTKRSIMALFFLGFFIYLLHFVPTITNNDFLASVLGGLAIGIGVGLVIRGKGSIDGIDILAIIISRGSRFSLGQTIFFFNISILILGGFVFGWPKMFYSLITYLFAYQTIDLIVRL